MNITDDEQMADLDERIEALIKSYGIDGVSVAVIGKEISYVALIRCGVLTAKGQLTVLSGGGAKDYVLTIAD